MVYSINARISWIILLLCSLLGLSSCSSKNDIQKIHIVGLFSKSDNLSLVLWSGIQDHYLETTTYTYPIVADTTYQQLTLAIPKKEWNDSYLITFYLKNTNKNDTVLIESIEVDGFTRIDARKMSRMIRDTQSIENVSIKKINEKKVLFIQPKPGHVWTFPINSYEVYKIKPIGIHLVFRIAFCCIVLLFLFFLTKNITQNRWTTISLCLFMSCLFLKISWANWTLGVVGVVSFITFFNDKNQKIHWCYSYYILLAICIIFYCGLLYSPIIPSGKFNNWLEGAPLIIFPFIFSFIKPFKRNINTILSFFIKVVNLFCLFNIISYVLLINNYNNLETVLENGKFFTKFLFLWPSFTHPSFVSIIICIAIPIAMYLKKENKISWIELLLVIVLTSTIIMLSGARIGLIIVPILLVLGSLYYAKVSSYIKYGIAICISIIALIMISSISYNEKFSDPIRQDQRKTAIVTIKEKPLFGWGTDSMETLLRDGVIAQKAGLEKPVGEFNHFHNQYLNMLVQFGFIGAIPFFALFIYLIYLAIKRKDFLLMAYLAIYIPFMYVESPFATAKGIQPMIFWLCFLLSTQKIRLGGELLPPSDNSELSKSNTLSSKES